MVTIHPPGGPPTYLPIIALINEIFRAGSLRMAVIWPTPGVSGSPRASTGVILLRRPDAWSSSLASYVSRASALPLNPYWRVSDCILYEETHRPVAYAYSL
jgi:hypothetical protein